MWTSKFTSTRLNLDFHLLPSTFTSCHIHPQTCISTSIYFHEVSCRLPSTFIYFQQLSCTRTNFRPLQLFSVYLHTLLVNLKGVLVRGAECRPPDSNPILNPNPNAMGDLCLGAVGVEVFMIRLIVNLVLGKTLG